MSALLSAHITVAGCQECHGHNPHWLHSQTASACATNHHRYTGHVVWIETFITVRAFDRFFSRLEKK